MSSSAMSLRITLLAAIVLCRCATRPLDVRDALVHGRQPEVDAFSRRVLAGDALITAGMLDDQREVDRAVVVRLEISGRTAQYGVDRVCDYFMCLLEARGRMSTREIVDVSSFGRPCKLEEACEVCNSLTYPIPPTLRERLRQYWRTRLNP